MKVLPRPPRVLISKQLESSHFVQFYDDEALLVQSVSHFISTGVEAGHAGIVIATETHRERLVEELEARRVQVTSDRKQGKFISLDARETLAKFMVNDWPSEERFVEVMGHVIGRAGSRFPRVRAFGEMVALLWVEGNHKAAIQLEGLWNNLANVQFFSLFCAYPKHVFSGDDDAGMRQICAVHTHVIPMGYKIG